MKFTLTSIREKILDIEKMEQAIIPTVAGEITILKSHEPMISALKPGILKVKAKGKQYSYAIGGGILETDGDRLNVIADMVEDGKGLDLEEIRKKKQEAQTILERYREEHATMDMDLYLELEHQFLKESAKEQLALK